MFDALLVEESFRRQGHYSSEEVFEDANDTYKRWLDNLPGRGPAMKKLPISKRTEDESSSSSSEEDEPPSPKKADATSKKKVKFNAVVQKGKVRRKGMKRIALPPRPFHWKDIGVLLG